MNESTYSAVVALDRLRRQLLDLYERYPLPAAPRGDYPPAAWREWREAAQHAYGVREGLLIAHDCRCVRADWRGADPLSGRSGGSPA